MAIHKHYAGSMKLTIIVEFSNNTNDKKRYSIVINTCTQLLTVQKQKSSVYKKTITIFH